MMSKSLFKLAVEELEEKVEITEENVSPESVIDENATVADLAEDSIDAQADQIDEAETILETTECMEDDLQAAVDSGEGVTEEKAESLEVAMEYFSRRIGFTKKMIPAKEGFTDSSTRLANTKLALENLGQLNKALKNNLVVAQEGLMDRIGNALMRGIHSEETTAKEYERASKAFDPEKGKALKAENPSWGRIFANTGKKEVNASDIATYADTIAKIANGEAVEAAKEVTKITNILIAGVDDSWFFATNSVVAKFKEMVKDSIELKVKYCTEKHGKGGSITVLGTDASGKAKLDAAVKKLILSSAQKHALKEMSGSLKKYNIKHVTNGFWRISSLLPGGAITGMALAPDLKAARKVKKHGVNDVADFVYEINSIRWKLLFGCYRYMYLMALDSYHGDEE